MKYNREFLNTPLALAGETGESGMGSRTDVISVLVIALAVLAAPIPVSAQESGGATPEKLWETDPSDVGPINDVAIDATGSIIAAVAADDSASNQQDGEVMAWDLAASKSSSDPAMQPHDPSELGLNDPFAPEGMGVVALEPAPEGKANLLAAGHEGTSGDSRSNIYVYDIEAGGHSNKEAGYNNEEQEPDTPVQALRFSEDSGLLLAHHTDELAFFTRSSGNEFKKAAGWSQAGEDIIDIGATPDLGTIVVSTTESPTGGNDVYRLYVLEVTVASDGTVNVEIVAGPEKRQGATQFNSVDIDDTGTFVVAGTENKIVYHYKLLDASGDDKVDTDLKFSTPWSQQRSSLGAIGEVAIGEGGTLFAVGYDSGHVIVYRQTRVRDDGTPIATPAQSKPFATGGGVQELAWRNQDTTLYVQASSLYAFNEIQFDPNKALSPLWVIPNVRDVAISHDGNRFAVVTGDNGQRVAAYEQAYEAQLNLEVPGQLRPGDQATLTLNVTNTGSAFDEYDISLADVPSGWNTQIDPPRVSLLPGQSRDVNLNLTPDRAQAPGTVSLTLEADSRFAPSDELAAERTVDLDIAEVHAAGVEADETTVAVDRGETATLTVTLKNLGNTDDTFDLEVKQDRGWDVTIDGQEGARTETDVSAAGSKTVSIGFSVPSSATEGSSNEVTIQAAPASGGTQGTATVTLLVEPAYGAAINGPEDTIDASPGEQTTFTVTVRNTGNTEDTLTLKAFSNATNDLFWEARLDQPTLTLGSGADRDVDVTVNVPRGAEIGDGNSVTVVARSAGSGEQVASASFDMAVPEETDDSPIALVLVPVALLAAALMRRRP